MRLLTIGIDGGDERIIRAMPMPFMHNLIREKSTPNLTGDLSSRGWAEIYTGKKAVETGAFYMSPILDGTHRLKQSFKHTSLKDIGIDSLWETLNKKGVSVGFMNIPTTSPAPKVNGFFIGGGGGGAKPSATLPKTLADSSASLNVLEKNEFISDIRQIGKVDMTGEELLDKLDLATKRLAQSFVDLVSAKEPDYGFLCFRVTTVVQYLAMSEIEAVIASLETAQLQNLDTQVIDLPLSPFQKRIVEHYALLDSLIQMVFEKVNPQSYLFCADHGSSNYKFNINVDKFLEREGFLVEPNAKASRSRALKKKALAVMQKRTPWLIESLKGNQSLLKKMNTEIKGPSFLSSQTKAFGSTYVAGIFVNDQHRFGGPVEDAEIDNLVDEICERLNATEDAKNNNLKAVPNRRNHKGIDLYDKLPDILVEKPDEYFFKTGLEQFINTNTNYSPVPENLAGLPDMNSGQKSRLPLFLASSDVSGLIQESDKLDLTLVHHLAVRFFENT